jgi:23S rRNA (uracil1939-C5)-methyltransferase
MNGKKKKPPVTRGSNIKLEIERLNHDGEGVGHIDGFTVFVPGTAPGDRVNARVISVQKTYARALFESLDTASPARVVSPCEHYGSCGGCQLQHISYEEQLRLKRELVRDALSRIGGLDVPVLPVIGMDEPWRYRNKAQIPVGLDGDRIKVGFFAKRSHRIVDVKSCIIQHPINDRVINIARETMQELNIPAYDEETHTGLIRHILARTSFTNGETLVVLVTNGRHLPRQESLVNLLHTRLENLSGIVQNINTRRGNIILGHEGITLWGQPYLMEKIGSLTFRISPQSFFQVNTFQTRVLYEKVLFYAALTGQETVFDLYCGIGTISLYLAQKARKVVGVESVAAAVEDARANAELNHATNTEFHVGLAEEVVPALVRRGYQADVAVVDPPRKGCDEKLLATITALRPARIVYVSCNPATLARDLKYLAGNGYNVQEVQPVDMFPHTSHVECVVLMSRV